MKNRITEYFDCAHYAKVFEARAVEAAALRIKQLPDHSLIGRVIASGGGHTTITKVYKQWYFGWFTTIELDNGETLCWENINCWDNLVLALLAGNRQEYRLIAL